MLYFEIARSLNFFRKGEDDAMKFIFDGYDLMPAIVARRTLLYEFSNYSNKDRANLVGNPLQEDLKNMAKVVPKQVVCFFGKQFQFPKEPKCACQCLYVINQHDSVIYLGTIFNQMAIEHYQARLPANYAKELDVQKVSRGRLLDYVIPISKEKIDELVIIEAAKKFFASFPKKTKIPDLGKVPICLLSAEKGEKLNGEILKQAKLTAKSVSKKEKLKKYIEDMVW
ncbi:MAG: hypothetical protein A3D48_04145 [Candidatus Yanofskybacteria bacterium RIFCSPHIGHO2_02_FULL_43_17]|uniref:Uncharacterized protein n=1 Tax=Candidatus Staskawiczbacteria bacterium RIFCSPHIGHO2_12_FULL_38_11 TaxID=1802209 RepID=A0A1G2I838_9BACT|nr:MAG: hypothetical protein A3D48_04145 [Candidatus Yanofskybacteria bacterium RIFCSPHIGHO2_02_FULL_43_17]OGZ70701.1 MAG: hypothetical protein A3F47_01840 [Candidatus Staskawiczbacteria bacterium RIFCSPHIGHO2_12_FULL_38_11]